MQKRFQIGQEVESLNQNNRRGGGFADPPDRLRVNSLSTLHTCFY